MQNTGRRVGQQQVTRFIGRHSRITSHSIPALSRVRRHHHRLARHYLARANVGAGFPHCPGVHGCIRPVTPSRPGLPHHISLNWEPSTLACRCCCTMTREGIWVLTRNCNTIIDISWLSHHTFGSPPCQLLARHESESGCLLAVEIGRTWQDCAFLAHIASIMAISHLSQSFTAPLLLHKETLMVSL